MIKFTILLTRNPALTHEQFVEHHRSVHATLFMSVPVVKETVLRYVQQHAIAAELPGMPPVKYDGITELWFADVRALGKMLLRSREAAYHPNLFDTIREQWPDGHVSGNSLKSYFVRSGI